MELRSQRIHSAMSLRMRSCMEKRVCAWRRWWELTGLPETLNSTGHGAPQRRRGAGPRRWRGRWRSRTEVCGSRRPGRAGGAPGWHAMHAACLGVVDVWRRGVVLGALHAAAAPKGGVVGADGRLVPGQAPAKLVPLAVVALQGRQAEMLHYATVACSAGCSTGYMCRVAQQRALRAVLGRSHCSQVGL